MTIKSYLFKSTKESIYKLANYENVTQKFEGIESTGIDPTTLTQLESILTGEDYYHIKERGGYTVFHRLEQEHGPVFVSSSKNLIKCLRNLSDDKKQEILERWCQTSEMSLYGWTPEKAEHIIDWLLRICHGEISPQEELILFVDLEDKETAKVS